MAGTIAVNTPPVKQQSRLRIASNQVIADTCGRECDKDFHRSPPKYRFHLIVKNRDRCTIASDTE